MYDSLLAWMANVTAPVFAEHRAPVAKEMRPFGGQAMNRIYETKDGSYIVLGGSEVKFAENLLKALGRLDLLDYARVEPGAARLPCLRTLSRPSERVRARSGKRFFQSSMCAGRRCER